MATRPAGRLSRRSPPSVQILAGHASLQGFLDSRLCFLCLSNLRASRAQCGHLLGCRHCTRHLRKCPFCRQHIQWTFEVRNTRVRNSSADSDTSSSSQLSTGSAATCPAQLSYQDCLRPRPSDAVAEPQGASLPPSFFEWQQEGIHCRVCLTQWPDLLQWQEHLSQGIHRNAMHVERSQTSAPFLEYCPECAFYYHDPHSWALHFGLHQGQPERQARHHQAPTMNSATQPLSQQQPRSPRQGHAGTWEGSGSASALSNAALPDLHSGVQAEPVICGACHLQLVGLAQLLDHFETPEHRRLRQDYHAFDALYCPYCKYWLNGLSQWEGHIHLPRHRRKSRAARAQSQSDPRVEQERAALPVVD